MAKEPEDTFPDVDGDAAQIIIADAAANTPPERSMLTYTAAHRRFRRAVDRDIAATPRGMVIDIPSELPRADMEVRE